MQDDLLNQMRNFMQNPHKGLPIPPPGEEKNQRRPRIRSSRAPKTSNLFQSKNHHMIPTFDSDIHQLIEECSIKVPEEQKQKMENTMLEFVKSCHHKEFLFTPILSTKEPENSLSMGYEHLSITPKTESDEVTESCAKNLLPIPSECEVTSEDKRECDKPVCENSSTVDVCENHSEILFDSNDDDLSSDDETFKDIEYVDASIPDPEIISVEEENVVHQEQEEVNLEEVQDIVLREKLFRINRLIANIKSLKDKPTPVCVFNSSTSIPILEESDNSLSLPELETFCDHTEETRSDNTTTYATDSLSEYDSFRFEIEPDQEKLFSAVMNDISDNSSNDPLLEEVNLFLPQTIQYHQDDPAFPQPPSEPSDDDFDFNPDFGEVVSAVMENIDEPNKDESFNPGEIVVSINDEDVDYFPVVM
uniref:Reverse transcriptase domain-containing protein n=1 Tax=Tanacetum cinerariifolium TaxID=118510 RepID=A0A699HBG5_TANCI|nr:hypothetical protein [Tanacetum cinerariifolium]